MIAAERLVPAGEAALYLTQAPDYSCKNCARRKRSQTVATLRQRSVALRLQTIVICRFDLTVNGPSIATSDRTYSLRPSEIHTLTDVGRFRVVAVDDLANLGYPGDRPGMDSDLRNLVRLGLLQRRGTSALKKESQHILTLTKQGQRFLRRHDLVPEEQTIYSGLVKPKEANHDASLYRLYQKAAGEIERKGGKVFRVQLDYELKEKLYRKLGKTQTQDERRNKQSKVAFAREVHLPVVNGKVAFPDLRIEYANQEMEISRMDLELATGHYHGEYLAEKARAGFQIYARSEDAPGLRRVRDEREIMTTILSL